jgi:CHRD domain
MTKFMSIIFATLVLLAATTARAAEPINSAYTMQMDSDQEVGEEVDSNNTGAGQFSYDAKTETLTYRITHNLGNDVLAGHIHGPAPRGENGNPIFTFDTTTSPIEGTWVMDDGQASDLLKDLLYVNLHTEEFPNGEIRGQIELAAVEGEVVAEAELDGDQQVPPVESEFGGDAKFVYSNFTGLLSYKIFHDVDEPVAMHIHGPAPPGENAGVLITLDENALSSLIEGEIQVNQNFVVAFLEDLTYLNIHTAENPDGEIRGQIIVTEIRTVSDDEDDGEDDDGLSGGAIFGIVFSVLVAVVALATAIAYYVQRRNRHSSRKVASAGGYVHHDNSMGSSLLDGAQNVEPHAV